MSAIAGIVVRDGRGVDLAPLRAMIAAAPGYNGGNGSLWRDDRAGLAHVMLATTPEAIDERQPYCDPASGATITFDGRIDNREEIGKLLGTSAPGRDAPDCAFVLAGWLKLGVGLLDRLAGDYALAIWEPLARRLSCARSPVGWRPLLWCEIDGGVAFATEPAMLMRALRRMPEINEGLIGEHLSVTVVSETDTLWLGVNQLPPGHHLVIDEHGARVRRWLEGPFEDYRLMSDSDHIDRFNHLFDQALVATSRSNGRIAAQLSGGLDSSSIVCRSRELVARGTIATMPEAVSARFLGENCDEGEWISAVEQRCGIQSATVAGQPFDWQKGGAWCATTLHLPLRPNSGSSVVPTMDWAQRSGISVVLTGEGGDELLNGSAAHFPDLLRAGHVGRLLREGLSDHPSPSLGQRWRGTLSSAIGPLVSGTRRDRVLWQRLIFTRGVPDWISPDWAKRIDLAERLRQTPQPPRLAGLAQAQRYLFYTLGRRHVLVDNLLCYAASRNVELRHPFYDFRVTRFLMGAAGGMLRRNGVGKHLLREAMRDTLPAVVRDRRDKADMSQPIFDAVAERLRQRPFHDLICVRNGWIDGDKLAEAQAVHSRWRADGARRPSPQLPYGVIWNALAIDLWLEHAMGVT